jgi:hypothetical protein
MTSPTEYRRALPVDEGIIKAEFKDKVAELPFDLGGGIFIGVRVGSKNAQGID